MRNFYKRSLNILNNMLTPEQITSVRTAAGKAPISTTPNSTGSLSDDFTSAWSKSPDDYGSRVQQTTQAGADTVAKSFEQGGKSVSDAWSHAVDQSTDPVHGFLAALEAMGHTAGAVAGTAIGTGAGIAKAAAAPVSQIKTPEGDTVGERFAKPIEKAASTVANSDYAQGVKQRFETQVPDHVRQSLMDLVNVLGLTGAGKVSGAPLQSAADTVDTLKTAGSDIATKVGTTVGAGAEKTIDTASKVGGVVAHPITSTKDVLEKGILPQSTKESMAGSGIPGLKTPMEDQVKTSAGRLAEQAKPVGMGAAIRPKPIDSYNDFVKQETKHLGDIKEDPAISLVGSRIGDAFKDVVKLRQAVGKTMSAELEKTATKAVDTGSAFGNFQKELLDNGAHYDSVNRNLGVGATSKFSTTDKGILEKYAYELQKLGSNPSMKALDAFISRVPNDIKALKASQNITFKTNAERLISNNLNDLRGALGGAGTKEYNAARAQYADLSKFVNEGAPFLGKITQSGDFAKDASIAKSAVQSVLNNGKKDWLIKLEDLTGYPALDESVLSLRAMEDMGDAKGSSLLKLLEEGVHGESTPHGFVFGMLKGAMGKTGQLLKGDRVEQTRSFLKGLKKP